LTANAGLIAPQGDLRLRVIRGGATPNLPARELSLRDVVRHGLPRAGLPDEVNAYRARNLPNLWRGARRVAAARALNLATMYGTLGLKVIKADGRVFDLGLVSMRVVTDTGVGFIVDAFQNLVELENMKYHGFGTGTGAEAAGDTALGTEFTTEYATDNTRPTGTTTESASNAYQTVATFSPNAGGTLAVTEHGVLSQAATGGGVLLDRSKFSAVNVVASADSIQSTYTLTLTSGS
jgi:hypothetical protein